MELLVIALPLIPLGGIAGYILARLTRPRITLRVVIVLLLAMVALVIAGRYQTGPNALGFPIVAFAALGPLALGGALGAALDWARRRYASSVKTQE